MSRMLFNTVNLMRKTPKIVTSLGFVVTSVALSAVILTHASSTAQIIPDASPGLANQAPSEPSNTTPSNATEQPNLAPPSLGNSEPDASRTVPALPTPDDNNTTQGNPDNVSDEEIVELVDAEAKDQPGELLTRGPIHEAFAKPVAEKVEAPKVIAKKPPTPIEELPPDEKPEGDNVVWIPGYFAWDDERKDYVWISGVYRDTPPGQTWVAGYWRETDTGYQWVNGFWTAANRQEVEYLPQPPEDLNNGPQGQQPSQDHFWVPGSWRYQQTRYMWQAGYWSQAQPGWVWIPAQYYWTPYGYVYSAGYWDLPLADRGLCYTPVYFSANVWNRPRFRYSPRVALNVGFVTDHLFLNLGYGSYYFGDYYGPTYVSYGYRPWCQPRLISAHYHDPLFSYYSWRYSNVGWANSLTLSYNYCLRNNLARPPRTYRDTYRLARNAQVNQAIVNGSVFQSNHNTINNVNITNITNNNINNTTIANNVRTKGSVSNTDLTVIQARNAAMVQPIGTSRRGPLTNPNGANATGTNINGKTQNNIAATTPNLLPVKLEKVDRNERQQFVKQADVFKDLSRTRLQQEAIAGAKIGGQNPGGKSGIPRDDFKGKNGNAGIAGQGNVNQLGANRGTSGKSTLTLPKIDGVASTSSNTRRNSSASNTGKGANQNDNSNPLILNRSDANNKLGNTNPGSRNVPGNRGINPKTGIPDSILNQNKTGDANKLGDVTGGKTIPGNKGINPRVGIPDSVNPNKAGDANKLGDLTPGGKTIPGNRGINPKAGIPDSILNQNKSGNPGTVSPGGTKRGTANPSGIVNPGNTLNPSGINNPTNPVLRGNRGTQSGNPGNPNSGAGNIGAGSGSVNNSGGNPGGKLPGGINPQRTFTPPTGGNPGLGTSGNTTINPNFRSNQGGSPTQFKSNSTPRLGGGIGSGSPITQPKINANPPVNRTPNVIPRNTNPGSVTPGGGTSLPSNPGGGGRNRGNKDKQSSNFESSNPIVDAGTSSGFQNRDAFRRRSVEPTGFTTPTRSISPSATTSRLPTFSLPSTSARPISGNGGGIQGQIRSQPRNQSSLGSAVRSTFSAPQTTLSQPKTFSTPTRSFSAPTRNFSSPSINTTSRSSSLGSTSRNFSRGSGFSGGQSPGGRNRQNR